LGVSNLLGIPMQTWRYAVSVDEAARQVIYGTSKANARPKEYVRSN